MSKKRRDKNDKRLLDEKLWKVFSKYIRKRDNNICFTCGKRCDGDAQAGHLHSRSHKAIKYHEKNVHCQCYACNIHKKGNLLEYQRNFVARYGQEAYDDLWDQRDEYAGHSVKWYNDMIDHYKIQIENL